jgi:uncharacterized protein (TIGR03435 family)
LERLVKFAWDFQDMHVRDNDEMLVGAPKWMDAERFDITAKPSSTGVSPDQTGQTIDTNSLHLMLRALLKDRFKLATHNEDQPISVYAMVADRPKLKRANPSNRAGCRRAPPPAGKATASASLFSMICQNTTMAQLAESLQRISGIYILHPVIDSTGLEGAWDFVLNWSPPHLLQGCGGCSREAGLAAVAAAAGAGPNGSLTLVEALDRQLGLKLKLQKHPMPILVIDHVEQKPTDN